MPSLELSDPLPKPIANVLIALVNQAEQDQSMDVLCATHTPDDMRYYILIGDGEGDGIQIEVPKGDPITSLEKLGYLEKHDQGHVFLLPDAFQRAKYERKSRFGKWIARALNKGHDVLLAASFILSLFATILSLLLAIKELSK